METVARRLVHLVRSSGGETEGATKAEMLYATSGMCTALASGGRELDVSRAPAPGSDRHLCKAYHSNRHFLYQTQHYEPPAVRDTVATDLSPVDWLARTPIPDTWVAIGSGCPQPYNQQATITLQGQAAALSNFRDAASNKHSRALTSLRATSI